MTLTDKSDMLALTESFKPFMTSGLVHPYHLDESISTFKAFDEWRHFCILH